MWGHNEDSDIADSNHTYLVSATIVDANDRTKVLENFTSYSYAGTVAGVAYGWNHHGLIVSLNALFSKLANLDRINDIAVCGCNYSYINSVLFRATNTYESTVFKKAQQLSL